MADSDVELDESELQTLQYLRPDESEVLAKELELLQTNTLLQTPWSPERAPRHSSLHASPAKFEIELEQNP